jgi:uncharacterized protein (TIGR02611 family)
MFEEIRKDWRIVREQPPGRRFMARYEYRRAVPSGSPLGRMLLTVLGATLVFVGIILLFLPGPGWLTIILGLALLAGRSRQLSRLLDWTELRLRSILRRLRPHRADPAPGAGSGDRPGKERR